MDPYDANYIKENVFSKEEIDEIRTFHVKAMPVMPLKLLKYLNSFRAVSILFL